MAVYFFGTSKVSVTPDPWFMKTSEVSCFREVPFLGQKQRFSNVDIKCFQNIVNMAHKPVALIFVIIGHAGAANPAFCPNQQFTGHTHMFRIKFHGKIKRTAFPVFFLDIAVDFLIKRNPVNAPYYRMAKIHIQIGPDFFIISDSEFINHILFHNKMELS